MNDHSPLLVENPDAVRNNNAIVVCALYKFITLPDYQALQTPLRQQLDQHAVRGTLLLAEEGINGTISGSQASIEAVLNWLEQDARFESLDYKLSYHSEQPFHRTKVKLKKEIVTMGVTGIDPNNVVGTYIEPSQWNALISEPDTVLIDTRNEYEVGIGTFKHAINPNTQSFREFPAYVQKHFDRTKHKKVAMFCTGGIRCEKASAYMKEQGFEEVYHLKGGILKYLETVDEKESLWNGECFVFDERVAVNHALEKGQYDQCHACRYPITAEDKGSKHYLPGVSCPRCYQKTSDKKKRRFKERERQVQLARQRGEAHIGSDSRLAAQKNRRTKQAKKQCQDGNIKAELRP